MLTPDLKPRLFAYMGGIVRTLESVAILINGPTDHVHILAALSTKIAPADFLRELKSQSSGWVHENFPEHRSFGWQTGYAALSVSESLREPVRKYIANQEQHHVKLTFQQEYIRLLEKHGISYDPRFVFD